MTTTFAAADPDRWSVRLARRYPHPVEKVWRAISRPEHLAAWFPASVAFVGGDGPRLGVEVRFGEPMEGAPALSGVVTDCDPPHLLAFTWDTDHLRFELSAVADGTELVLWHAFDDRAGAASFATGWEGCLAALGRDLAGEAVPGWSRAERRHEELADAFGLDAPIVDEVDSASRWRLVLERQLVASAEVMWDLLPGPETDGAAAEVVPGELLAWDCGPGEPGDAVRLALVEGTGHGARLEVTVTGSVAAERDVARDRWHHRVADLAAEALDRALAATPSSSS